jgi:hypothetical protein
MVSAWHARKHQPCLSASLSAGEEKRTVGKMIYWLVFSANPQHFVLGWNSREFLF